MFIQIKKKCFIKKKNDNEYEIKTEITYTHYGQVFFTLWLLLRKDITGKYLLYPFVISRYLVLKNLK